MSKSGRDIEHLAIRFVEFDSEVLLKRSRIWAQIDDDVIDRTTIATYYFHFFEWMCLIVHAAQCAFSKIEGDATLLNPGF